MRLISMENQEQFPLVSVPVITYNSSKTVLETLDSIYAQTYPTIELIISDDCSTDDTVRICQNWIDKNKDRFVRVELLTVPHNTGVSANCNRAAKVCQGEWVKGIAGDDILLPNCISDCMKFASVHPDMVYLFGKVIVFGSSNEDCDRVSKFFDYNFFNLTQEQQLQRLIFEGNCIPASAAFYNKKNLDKIGVKNDERIPLLEDWPKWINLLKAGAKLHFIDKGLVKYRISQGSLSAGNTLSLSYKKSIALVYILYQFKPMYKASEHRIDEIHRYVRCKIIVTGKWYWFVINRLMKILGNE